MDDYCQIGLTPEEYAAEKLGIPDLSELKTKKQSKVIRKFKEDQNEELCKFLEDEYVQYKYWDLQILTEFSDAIEIARNAYVKTTALLYMITPSVEEGLSFEEASDKSAKRFDRKLTQTEKAAFYRFTTLLKKSKSAGEKADESKKIADLEASVASKDQQIAELEKKLKKVKDCKHFNW